MFTQRSTDRFFSPTFPTLAVMLVGAIVPLACKTASATREAQVETKTTHEKSAVERAGTASPMDSNPHAQPAVKPMELVPGNTLITATPELGRALAITLSRHSIHAIQPGVQVLKEGRPKYSTDPNALIEASKVIAIEFATIAAANNYWR